MALPDADVSLGMGMKPLMWIERWPVGTAPTFVAALHLTRFSPALTAAPQRIAWKGTGDLTEALELACKDLRVTRPTWKKGPDGRYVGPVGYVSAEYCATVERVCSSLLRGWRIAGDEESWDALLRNDAGGASGYFDRSGGYLLPSWASHQEDMLFRFLGALRFAAHCEAAGNPDAAWQAVAAASFSAGAAVASAARTREGFDAILRAVRSDSGRHAAKAKDAQRQAPNRAKAKELWEGWQSGKLGAPRFANNSAFASHAEDLGLCKHQTALKWCTKWKNEAR